MTKRNPAIIPILLLMALPMLLPAADKAYVVAELKPMGKGVQLVLRDLENEDKLFQLVVYEQDRLIDLAEGREAPGTGLRQGDILFIGKGRQMFIAPGRTVHAKLAAGQPEEAKAINELSRRLAAGASAPRQDAGPDLDDGAGAELDKVRRAFLFVLEFALGAPFTAAQERLILEQFGPGWWDGKSPAERKSFLQYPQVVAWILKAGQKDLEEMRGSLEETTRQWLKESPASDAVVAMIRGRLAERGRKVVSGDPPLTEMAAAAFSELYAYSRQLRRNASALPEQVPAAVVAGARAELLRAWPRFSAVEKAQVATTPGLWLVLRTLVAHGDPSQRRHALERLLSVTSGEATTVRGRPAGKGDDPVAAMFKRNVLMNIQQQTFNQYMWSRGFNYQPATGKMW
jgi:hypothetical protein